ncbi:MAG: ribose-phosphate diphosphokinase [Gammaproteobacteria bacterium]|nr:ribose-phosphate diphosphokinase [Gammaproteobacteria bacterium]
MSKIIFALPQNNALAITLADKLKVEIGLADIRNFPDGETYIRIDSDVKDKIIILVFHLDHPNNHFLSLIFLTAELKKLGAKKICLVAPYLPYMRQDTQFKPGEAVTAILFAKLLSSYIDELITIDPHLHRIKNLSEIYSVPTILLHATKPIAEWIKNNVKNPLIIGPDEESTQWVEAVARYADAPYVIVKKIRHGDRKVSVTLPEINDTQKTPVLVDDIISTGMSMCAVIKQLLDKQFKNPICIGVHALFNKDDYQNLMQAGAQTIISCDTISHPSNEIDISDLLIEGIKKC